MIQLSFAREILKEIDPIQRHPEKFCKQVIQFNDSQNDFEGRWAKSTTAREILKESDPTQRHPEGFLSKVNQLNDSQSDFEGN